VDVRGPLARNQDGIVPAIVIDSLVKTYPRGLGGLGGRVRALDGVSLSVEHGETLGIIGPNGAGKTTLLGCLLGFLRPDTGTVRVNDREPDDLAIRSVTGYLPERLVLDRWMTGRDFLRYHHGLARLPEATRTPDVDAALGRVGLEPASWSLRVGRYSRGMLQRLALAQAMLGHPKFLFLDEPVSGVDPTGVLLFRRLISELASTGCTILINSHQLAEIERVCSRVVFVKQGRVEAVETVRAGAAHARVLRVRLSTEAPAPDAANLTAAATRAGASFEGWVAPDARFGVDDDAGATRLLGVLLAAGVPVIEAAPEEGRLERLFTSDGPVASASHRPEPADDVSRFAPPSQPDAESQSSPSPSPPQGGSS
jgi:ABC-2 type transport system ATP-binding protein